MRIAFHALNLLTPFHSCGGEVSARCLSTALDIPPLISQPVVDDLGIQYAFDLALTDGAYLVVGVALALGALRLVRYR